MKMTKNPLYFPIKKMRRFRMRQFSASFYIFKNIGKKSEKMRRFRVQKMRLFRSRFGWKDAPYSGRRIWRIWHAPFSREKIENKNCKIWKIGRFFIKIEKVSPKKGASFFWQNFGVFLDKKSCKKWTILENFWKKVKRCAVFAGPEFGASFF